MILENWDKNTQLMHYLVKKEDLMNFLSSIHSGAGQGGGLFFGKSCGIIAGH